MRNLGVELALDFMFWPSAKRKFGSYLERGLDDSFANCHEHSLGITGGLPICNLGRGTPFQAASATNSTMRILASDSCTGSQLRHASSLAASWGCRGQIR